MPENIELLDKIAQIYGIQTQYKLRRAFEPVRVKEETIIAILNDFGVQISVEDINSKLKLQKILRIAQNQEWLNLTTKETFSSPSDSEKNIDIYTTTNEKVEKVELRWDPDFIKEIINPKISLELNTEFPQKSKIINGKKITKWTYKIPADAVVCGYHTIYIKLNNGRIEQKQFIVYPNTKDLIEQKNKTVLAKNSWGIISQIYSVRSKDSWGIGDFEDLKLLAKKFAKIGADFITINPVHSDFPLPTQQNDSPYLPSSRMFINPIYIRPENLPIFKLLPKKLQKKVIKNKKHVKKLNFNGKQIIDRKIIWEAKLKSLKLIFDYLYPILPSIGESAYCDCLNGDYTKLKRTKIGKLDSIINQIASKWELFRKNKNLWDFSYFMLFNELGLSDKKYKPLLLNEINILVNKYWAVDDSISENRKIENSFNKNQTIELIQNNKKSFLFWFFVQWGADYQLKQAQQKAIKSGMSIGIVQDLAVGVGFNSADVKNFENSFNKNYAVGAPPDYFNQLGQEWGQPPLSPQGLDKTHYALLRGVFQNAFKSAGALRIDHMLGFFRLWWIPKNLKPQDGAYVWYDYKTIFSILCLEAFRTNSVIFGEMLGTKENWFDDFVKENNILATEVFWTKTGIDPKKYEPECLMSVANHDFPPTKSYLNGEHIKLRKKLGQLTRKESQEFQDLKKDKNEIVKMLKRNNFIKKNNVSNYEICVAIYKAIASSPCKKKGILLTDLVGDVKIQNQPGTNNEQYSNWCIPLTDKNGKAVLLNNIEKKLDKKILKIFTKN